MNLFRSIGCILLSLIFCDQSVSWAQSIIINEIMVHPTATTWGGSEYVEIYNTGVQTENLSAYIYRVGNRTITLPAYFLAPKQYAILINEADRDNFVNVGNVVPLARWFILNNTSGTISLYKDDGVIIDSVSYTNRWYRDSQKSRGGWSIERINPYFSCPLADNWKASEDFKGGTPGQQNSTYNRNHQPSISITNAEIEDNQIFITLNSTLLSEIILNQDNIQISPSIGEISSIQWLSTDNIAITFSQSFLKNQIYNISFKDIIYCSTPIHLSTNVVYTDPVEYNDIVINEVLFNPRLEGNDFVEIYNASSKVIDLQNWRLGNRNIIDQIHLMHPGDYRVLTDNSANIIQNYPSAVKHNFIQMSSIPRYANEQGIVTLYHQNTLVDSLYYTSSMHQPFLSNRKGISLERVSQYTPTLSPGNFKSAASLSEGATPGYQNSQDEQSSAIENTFFLTSRTFSPDGDGHEDELQINYALDNNSYMVNVTIYNNEGIIVKHLVRNQSIGVNGHLIWNGEIHNSTLAPAGIYVYVIELYNANGYLKTYKNSFVLVRRERSN